MIYYCSFTHVWSISVNTAAAMAEKLSSICVLSSSMNCFCHFGTGLWDGDFKTSELPQVVSMLRK